MWQIAATAPIQLGHSDTSTVLQIIGFHLTHMHVRDRQFADKSRNMHCIGAVVCWD